MNITRNGWFLKCGAAILLPPKKLAPFTQGSGMRLIINLMSFLTTRQ